MSTIASTRSVLSLGLSCFKLNPAITSSPSASLSVQTYNIILLCEEDYVVEPISLQFLVKHGFDFNQQYAKGDPYYRGNDQVCVVISCVCISVPFWIHIGLIFPVEILLIKTVIG